MVAAGAQRTPGLLIVVDFPGCAAVLRSHRAPNCSRAIAGFLIITCNHREALAHAEYALSLFMAIRHRAGQGRALNVVGWYSLKMGDIQRESTCVSRP
jgi:hypothetical protein